MQAETARTSSRESATAYGEHALVPGRGVRKPHFCVRERARRGVRGDQQLKTAERREAGRPEAEVVVRDRNACVRGVVRPLRHDHALGAARGEPQASVGRGGLARVGGVDAAHEGGEVQDAGEHEGCEGGHEQHEFGLNEVVGLWGAWFYVFCAGCPVVWVRTVGLHRH